MSFFCSTIIIFAFGTSILVARVLLLKQFSAIAGDRKGFIHFLNIASMLQLQPEASLVVGPFAREAKPYYVPNIPFLSN